MPKPTTVQIPDPQAPIAVIGMAAVLPKARNLGEYWSRILDGTECLEPVPASRWRLDQYHHADPAMPDRTYADRGGFVPDIDFDPLLYGIPPNNLDATDSAQLYAMVTARQALLDAGYATEANGPGRPLPAARSGVVLGVAGTTMELALEMARRSDIPKWQDALRQAGVASEQITAVAAAMGRCYPQWSEDTFPGMLANIVAGRVANRFGLGGASHVVDAACASSLAAVRLACQELRSGAADLMVSGGVDTDNSPLAFMSFSKTPALSRTGKVRAFDADADGTLISEGVAMLVLKRLADAEADGDRIYGVIRGAGASTDAAGGAIYAPRSEGQLRALRNAYAEAGYAASSVGLIEAHATGTAVGDAVEIAALQTVLEGAETPVALGSVKSQIGHTKAAAGAASLVKTLLALHHKVLPPTLNVRKPNARLGRDGPLYLPRQARPWSGGPGRPRRAGVSAFGFGGANVHLALEEYAAAVPAAPGHRRALPLLLSAATPAALARQCGELAARFEQDPDHAQAWPDAPPPPAQPRLGLVAADAGEAAALLRKAAEALVHRGEEAAWSLERTVHYRRRALEDGAKVVAVFSGQGSQTVGMGARLAIDFPELRAIFEAFDADAQARGHQPISALLYPPETSEPAQTQAQRQALTHTLYAQASIGAYTMAVYTFLRKHGFSADLSLGHSFGELSALWSAGSLDDQQYRAAVLARGAALTPPKDHPEGGLLALRADAERVRALLPQLPGVSLANLNSPRQTVVGGDAAAIAQALPVLEQAGIQAVRIPVAAAFHTAHVGYAEAAWGEALAALRPGAPQSPVLANLTAEAYPADPAGVRALLRRQPFGAVRFREQIEAAYAAGGRVFVEIGPRSILTGLVGEILEGQAHLALATAPNPAEDDSRQVQSAAVQLAVLGLPLRLAFPAPAVAKAPAGALTIAVSAANHRIAKRPAWPQVDAVPAPAAQTPAPPPPGAGLQAQAMLADAHRQFLDGQLELARSLAEHAPPPAVLAQIERHQEQAMALHLQFLQGQQALLGRLDHPAPVLAPQPGARDEPPPVVMAWASGAGLDDGASDRPASIPAVDASIAPASAPVPQAAPPAAASRTSDVSALLLRIVAEKTGFPAEMLNADMRLEADLGVDSIKRVEILASIRDAVGASEGGPLGEELRQAATIAEIAALLGGHAAPAQPAAPQAAGPAVDIDAMLLRIVAEKTGFPVDMLNAGMRLEADLGIDSIKRVEILASVRDALGIADAGEAGDALRAAAAIGDIAALLRSRAQAPAEAGPPAVAADTQVDVGALLLRIVAEKTGFPAELLDAGMRLEADLGVDSIKRVEILAGVRDALGIADGGGAGDGLRQADTIAEMAGLLARHTGSAAASAADPAATATATVAADDARRWRAAAVRAIPLAPPQPAERAAEIVRGGYVLLFDDGGPLTQELAARLLRQGQRPQVLSVAGWSAGEADGTGLCCDLEGLSGTLAALAKEHGKPTSALLLLPAGDDDAASRRRLALALRIVQALLPWQLRCILGCARLDGRLGYDGGGDSVAGGLAGLLKTLRHEHPRGATRFVDLAASLPPAEAGERLLLELLDCLRSAAAGDGPLAHYPAECGWNAQGRWTLARGEDEAAADETLPPLQTGDLVLVTGGARGITAACIEALAARVPAHFILIGRTTPAEHDPDWARGCEAGHALKAKALEHLRAQGAKPTPRMLEEACRAVLAAREVRGNLQALRAHGARVDYLALDLGDAVATRHALAALIGAHGPVKMLVHGAGALSDRRIADKSPQDLEQVFAPKLDALLTLLDALAEQPPRRLLLFSSTAGYSGNAGQSDYAMANEALSKLAFRLGRAQPQSRVVSLAWGPWAAGMVDAALKKLFAERGIGLLPVAAGAAIFAEAALSRRGGGYQYVIGETMPAAGANGEANIQLERAFSPADDPLIGEHRIDRHAVLPSTWIIGWMKESATRWQGRVVTSLEDYRVFKGVAFETPAPVALRLQLRADGPAALRASVTDAQGRPRFAGTLRFDQPLAAGQRTLPQTEASVCDPRRYLAGPIQYGPGFRGVERVLSLDEHGALVECRVPAHLPQAGRAPDALAFDIATHACLIWLMEYRRAACLPASTGRLSWRGDAPTPRHFFVAMRVRGPSGQTFRCDLELCDEQGRVFAAYDDFVATVIEADSPLWGESASADPLGAEVA